MSHEMTPVDPNTASANVQVICAGECRKKLTYDAAQKAGWEATEIPFKFICPDCKDFSTIDK